MATLNEFDHSKTPPISIGMDVYFRSKVFEHPYTPYYDAYKGHKFRVTGVYEGGHITLICLDDPNVIVKGAVHADELKCA